MKFRDGAPAYLEYASDMLANRNYRTMSLPERGLLDTLRRECWVSGSVPAYPPDMARVLGFAAAEIEAAYTPRVQAFFELSGGDLVAPDLERYRAELAGRKARMAEGGRIGGRKTQRNRPKSDSDQAPLEATLQAPLVAMVKPLRGIERNGKERRGLSIGSGDSSEGIDAGFVAGYEQAEATMKGIAS